MTYLLDYIDNGNFIRTYYKNEELDIIKLLILALLDKGVEMIQFSKLEG